MTGQDHRTTGPQDRSGQDGAVTECINIRHNKMCKYVKIYKSRGVSPWNLGTAQCLILPPPPCVSIVTAHTDGPTWVHFICLPAFIPHQLGRTQARARPHHNLRGLHTQATTGAGQMPQQVRVRCHNRHRSEAKSYRRLDAATHTTASVRHRQQARHSTLTLGLSTAAPLPWASALPC